MDGDLINAYIERVMAEVIELTKSRMMLEAQLKVCRTAMESMRTENERLQAALNKKTASEIDG